MSVSRQLRGTFLAALMALGGLAAPAQATITVGFDPNGILGGIGTLQVATFDPGPANAIAVNYYKPAAGGGLRLPTVGETFNLLYQGTIDLLRDANNNNIWAAGISNGGNTGTLTITASLTEQIVSASATSAIFTTVPGGTINWYFNPVTNAANPLAGTGFVGPQLIYTGTFLAGPNGTFAVTPASIANPGPLDNFQANNYPTIQSVAGAGGTNLNVQTVSYDATFFTSAPPANLLIQLFNTSNNLPFSQVDPSAVFFNGQPGATVASLGTINGVPTTGPNVMFQSDANIAFDVVPEPGTIQMALTAVGLASLGGLRTYRRRSKTASA